MNSTANAVKLTREERMARGPIIPTMLALGIPSFLAQLVNLLYNVVDRIYIGHIKDVGAAALTGVGVCFPIIMFISAFASFVGAGGAPLAGIAFGKGDKQKSEKILGNGFTLLIIFSAILTVVFQIIKKPFLFMFGASEATYVYAEPYLNVYLWGTVFVMLAMGLNAYITVQGESTIAMMSVAIGAIANLVLDPVFIFGFDMGVKGAAYATIISQGISAAWIIRFLTSERAVLKLRVVNLMLNGEIVGKIAALGISPFIMGATESFITIAFNSGAQRYGNDLYVGSITILQSIMQIIFLPMNGFTQGVSPMISYNYGAKNLTRVKGVALRLIGIAQVFSFSLSALFMLFPGKVAAIFTNDTELIELCSKVLPIFVCGMLVFGLQSAAQTCFMALSKAVQALFFACFRKVILLIPLAITLPMITGSVMGIYYAEPISDTLSAICCFTVFLITLHSIMKSECKNEE